VERDCAGRLKNTVRCRETLYDLGCDHVDYVRNVAGMQARSSAVTGMLSLCMAPGTRRKATTGYSIVHIIYQECGHDRTGDQGLADPNWPYDCAECFGYLLVSTNPTVLATMLHLHEVVGGVLGAIRGTAHRGLPGTGLEQDCALPDYSLMATIWAWRHRPFAQKKKQWCC
jgi:hypothetical protein